MVNHEDAEPAQEAEEEQPARAETGRVLYFVEPLTSRQSTEVLPAIEKMVNQINLEFKGNVVSQVVYRLHGDKAPELTGLRAKEWGRARGIVVTSTAAYEPNANGRAERAIGLLKQQTRAMVIGSALNKVQELWPLAVKHAASNLPGARPARHVSRYLVPGRGWFHLHRPLGWVVLRSV